MQLAYEPAIAVLDIYFRGIKIYVYMKNCTWMFRAVLLILDQKYKQYTCPSTGELLNCGTYIQWNSTLIKRNKLLIHAKTWINLQGVMLSKKKKIPRYDLIYVKNTQILPK